MKKATNPIKSQPNPEAGRKSSAAITMDHADEAEDEWARKIRIEVDLIMAGEEVVDHSTVAGKD